MTGVFLTIFALFWSGMVLAFDGFMGHGIYKQFQAQHFLTATGTIMHSELTSSRSSKGGTSYSAHIEYSYHVDGQVFTGDQIRFGIHSSGYASASSIVNAHPVGSEAQVYYNPADPHESLLEPGVKGTDLMGFIFMTPFNMVMLGLWLGIGGWLREHWFKPVAGGVKIISDGLTTRIRFPQFPAIAWGIITTGGLGFASIFIVGITTNMEPSITVAVVVLAGIYLAGLVVYLWQRQKINSGIDDLILDEAARTIELPLTFDRKERITAGIDQIQSLSVEKIMHRSSKGGISYTYQPTLCLRGTDVSVQKLADWSDEMKVNAFADWLRQKLNPNLPAKPVADAIADELESENQAAVTAREKEFEELRRNGKSRIKVSDGPEGREFYFPAARNVGTALFLTSFTFCFTGAAGAMFYFHAPIFFPIIFGIVGVLMIYGVFNMWFRSVRITVNSTTVRVRKSWLIFSRTRDFSAGDYTRFTTKTGMQSGSTIFTDIRLVRARADAEFAQGMKRFEGTQQVNQLVAERFRQAAGPLGVTVASSIANSAEAEWLVKEMNRAFGR
jgi:hypothetical protein